MTGPGREQELIRMLPPREAGVVSELIRLLDARLVVDVERIDHERAGAKGVSLETGQS